MIIVNAPYRSAHCVMCFPDPTIAVSVVAGGASPVVGTMYSLTCTVTGAEGLTNSTVTYQWFRNGGLATGQRMKTLSFTSLTYSDAGRYTCEATIMSSLLSTPIKTTSANSVDIVLTCKSFICCYK